MLEKLEGHRVDSVDVIIRGIIFEIYFEGTGTHDHGQFKGLGTWLGRINNDHPKESPDHVQDGVRESLIHVDTKLYCIKLYCIKLVDRSTTLRNRLECQYLAFSPDGLLG